MDCENHLEQLSNHKNCKNIKNQISARKQKGEEEALALCYG